jgi:hypothetical protein
MGCFLVLSCDIPNIKQVHHDISSSQMRLSTKLDPPSLGLFLSPILKNSKALLDPGMESLPADSDIGRGSESILL